MVRAGKSTEDVVLILEMCINFVSDTQHWFLRISTMAWDNFLFLGVVWEGFCMGIVFFWGMIRQVLVLPVTVES